MPEGRIACEVAGEDISCSFKFFADEAEPKEPGSHGILGVFVLLRFRAGGFDFLCHLAESEAKLDVAFQLAGVDTPLAVCGGFVKLEKSELNGALCKGGVEVQHVVSAVVVMQESITRGSVADIPNIGKVIHGGRLLVVDFTQEGRGDRAAVLAHTAAVKAEGFGQEAFVAGHDVCQIA